MAQKKVILKDGADELLPKTSASMVFTESGQTVENALKNAGGGGTGGIDEEQLAQYLSQHKYITQTALDEAHYLKPTSPITGYSKASNYTALAPTDTLNEALGKLEAGIGSGGAGGGDDTYFINANVALLVSGSTTEEIYAAFGGKDKFNEAVEAAGKKKKIYICGDALCIIPVSATSVFGAIGFFSFTYANVNGIIIKYLTEREVREYYPDGYALSSEVYSLNSDSNSDDISAAVKGESGVKKIIRAVKDGNRLVIRGTNDEMGNMTINQDVQCNMYVENDNGDMGLYLYGRGHLLWGGTGGILSIEYTKSSNTFKCQLTEI